MLSGTVHIRRDVRSRACSKNPLSTYPSLCTTSFFVCLLHPRNLVTYSGCSSDERLHSSPSGLREFSVLVECDRLILPLVHSNGNLVLKPCIVAANFIPSTLICFLSPLPPQQVISLKPVPIIRHLLHSHYKRNGSRRRRVGRISYWKRSGPYLVFSSQEGCW